TGDVVSALAMRYVDTHGLEIERVLAASSREAAVIARARLTGFSYQVAVAIAPGDGKLASVHIALEPPPRESAPPRPPEDVARELGAFVDRLARDDVFSGVVLVTRGDDTVYAAARGAADRSASTPNTLDTRFNIASIGKMFTAVAIQQLMAKGTLTL